jgi:hypothetical protein
MCSVFILGKGNFLPDFMLLLLRKFLFVSLLLSYWLIFNFCLCLEGRVDILL